MATSDDLSPDDVDEYEVTLDDGTVVNAIEVGDTFSVSADRKVQLEQFEPISSHASRGGEFPEDLELTPEDRLAIIMANARLVRDVAETALMRRYEENIRG